jgi:isoquinoline 1-oxidoreductase beta subunit
MVRVNINGTACELDCAADTPLLWVLRDTLGLRGTKYGCGVGICGICTVLADGEPLRSCVVPVGEVADRHIVTIEGLAAQGHPVLSAWIADQVPQCGYCQPGQILAAVALLRHHPDPNDAQIDGAMTGVLCRCGTYQRIRHAIRTASKLAPSAARPLALPPAPLAPGIALDDWIRIAADGAVTVVINHSEMGQGVTTALAMLVAEELEVDLARVRTEFAPVDRCYRNPLFNEQTTGGSTSVRGEWERLSQAGAGARLRLLEAAARRWGVPRQDCVAAGGSVTHSATGRRLGYGELAPAAAGIRPPERVVLKGGAQCRLLGHALPRLDVPDMVGGRTVFGMDLSLPDLRVASLARCPVVGGKVASFDPADALAVPGVEAVVEVGRGVAVVARDTWSALRGRAALRVAWDYGAHASLETADLEALLRAALDREGEVRRRVGRVERVSEAAARTLTADYATAPLAHATLEPMNCTAQVAEGGCQVWVGTQSPEAVRKTAARVAGVSRTRVQVHTLQLGGGFGRRLETDMVEEAVELSGKVGAPVQVVWTRGDDLQHDFYRPLYRVRFRAGLDADGWPLAWFQRAAGQSIAGEGCAELAYGIPNVQSEFVALDSPLPAGAWRSVGAGQEAFAVESFIDELARVAGRDPFEYRRALLRDAPRHRAVLELAAQAAGWGGAAAPGRHRGIATYRSFGSYVAQVAEVSVSDGTVRVHRVVCAIDCGRVVNPDIVRAQMEGGVAFGLSAALMEAVHIQLGRVTQATFDDYPILTLAEMPEVEVHIMASDASPGGVGEPGVPPIAPAVANAVAAATGTRLRALPLQRPGIL